MISRFSWHFPNDDGRSSASICFDLISPTKSSHLHFYMMGHGDIDDHHHYHRTELWCLASYQADWGWLAGLLLNCPEIHSSPKPVEASCGVCQRSTHIITILQSCRSASTPVRPVWVNKPLLIGPPNRRANTSSAQENDRRRSQIMNQENYLISGGENVETWLIYFAIEIYTDQKYFRVE